MPPGVNKFMYPAHAAEMLAAVLPGINDATVRDLLDVLARMTDDRDRALEDFLSVVANASGITTGFPITFSTPRTVYLIDHQDNNTGISDDLYLRITDIASGMKSEIRMQNLFGFSPPIQQINLGTGGSNPASLIIPSSGQFSLADGIHTFGAPIGQTFVDLGNKTGTVVANLSTSGAWRIVLGGNVTFNFAVSGFTLAGLTSWEHLFYIHQDGTGGRTVTWPAVVRWPGGVAPTITAAPNAVDLVLLRTHDQFSDIYGQLIGANYS